MKAIRVRQFGDPEVLQLEDVDVPRPGPNEILVRIKAVGVNPYDTYMRSGAYGARNPVLPYTPGSDAAGTVERVGPGCDSFDVGARVYTSGTSTGAYAEFELCKIDQAHPLPDRVSFSQGAALYVPYATAFRSLFQLARARPGETELVHGASGGVGIAALQWARAAGLTVIGTAGTEDGLRLIAEQGARYTFNHRLPGYQHEILKATQNRGVNVILEMLANLNLGEDLKLLAPHGRIVVVGSRGDVQITPREIMLREATITGVLLWNISGSDAAEIYAAIGGGLNNGGLQPIVGREMPLSEAAEAHRRVMQSGALGKIVLVP